MWWAGPRPWVGGTFLHHLPKHARTGPALPACPLTQASRSQAYSVPPPPTCFPTSSAPVPLSAGQGRRDSEPWQKDLGNNKNSPPQTAQKG